MYYQVDKNMKDDEYLSFITPKIVDLVYKLCNSSKIQYPPNRMIGKNIDNCFIKLVISCNIEDIENIILKNKDMAEYAGDNIEVNFRFEKKYNQDDLECSIFYLYFC